MRPQNQNKDAVELRRKILAYVKERRHSLAELFTRCTGLVYKPKDDDMSWDDLSAFSKFMCRLDELMESGKIREVVIDGKCGLEIV
jgi:hypothetical protein